MGREETRARTILTEFELVFWGPSCVEWNS